jgi:hypothetical protein
MTTSHKTQNGIDYTLERRTDHDMTQQAWFWRGDDDSVLEPTTDEVIDRIPSRHA